MTTDDQRFQLTHPDSIPPIGDHLREAGYTERAVCERLRVDQLPSQRTRRQRLRLFLQRTRSGDALDMLIRLFLLQQSVSVDALRQAVAPMELREWQDAGLLVASDNAVSTGVELYPYGDTILACDWSSQSNPDEVMSVSASSRLLAQMTIRRRSAHTLDLGAGGGIQSLLAASHSDRVTAVDCNPRAMDFGRFNAALNGRENIFFQSGNLFEPVDGQTFDLIVSCPPFVISPGVDLVHTHNDMPADQLCRSIVETSPRFLNDDGYCQVIGNWAQIGGQDWRERLAALCTEIECDAVLSYSHTEDVATYAFERLQETADDVSDFDEWLKYFETLQIEAVGFGLLTVRRKKHATSWFHAEPFRVDQNGDTIERRFAICDFLEEKRDDRALLDSRLRLSDRTRLHQQSKHTGSDWNIVETQLRTGNDSLNVGPEVLAFFKCCDGKRTVFQSFRAAAPKQARNAAPPPVFLKVVRRLVEMGILVWK